MLSGTMASSWFLLIFAVIVFPTQGFDEKKVDETISKAFKCRSKVNPAMSVVVVKNGKVLFSKGYGLVDPDDPDTPVTNQTVFGIASISKSFAATLLVKLLYEKTNLTVDSKVKELLGDQFQMPDELRTQETTFSDLMAHKTAVPPNNRIRFDGNLTRATILERLPLLEAPHQFRVKYMYNNLMYGLVTRLAEIIGDETPWEDLMHQHLLEPLGMGSTTFATRADFSRPDVAKAVEEDIRGDVDFLRVSPEFSRRWAELAGSGSVMSSGEDMAKWLNFHIYKGANSDGEQVMQEKHLAEVHRPRFYISTTNSKETRRPRFPVTASEDLYCHGFRTGFYRGYRRMTHTGSTFGYRAMMSILPYQKIGVFTAITGRDDSYMFRVPLNMYLMDMALGFEPSWLNASTICSYPSPWKKRKRAARPAKLNPNVKLKRDVSEYEGTYHHPAYGYLDVVYNETLSALEMIYGWGRWQLYTQYYKKSKRDKFYGKGLGVTDIYAIKPIDFLGDPNNRSAILQVKVGGFEPLIPPVFLKNGPIEVTPKPVEETTSAPVVSNKTMESSPKENIGATKSGEGSASGSTKTECGNGNSAVGLRGSKGVSVISLVILMSLCVLGVYH